MFIRTLNPEQQEALCRIVRFIAEVDGEQDARETLVSAALLAESSLSAVPEKAADLDEAIQLAGRFSDSTSRRALILECLGVALADQVAHPAEIEAIHSLSEALQLSDSWVEQARDYVQRQLDMQREGAELLMGA